MTIPRVVRPLVMCGPSGVGKGTLINKLMHEFPTHFGFSVSHTTRAPRPGEQDGVHYHFVSQEEMQKGINQGKFIEHAHVHGNYYGTSYDAVSAAIDAGKICVLDIDVQGARQVKKSNLNALMVFINPPSYEELERRLRGRGTETEDKIIKRLANARGEMEAAKEPGLFDYVITNDDLEQAYEKLKSILVQERML
eukprot:GEZU01032990.1.p1 GENE.GEZU01032990.1~~GEZU01032990.1.p1  ORF type:complete len:195 (-),score=57.47 GEZU01032990.1:295-879(-)